MFRWELEDLAREQLTGMPPPVQLVLSNFMDVCVIVDPADYQRRPGEAERPLRTLPFGQAGLVTFLVYKPDELVLVTRVIWAGLTCAASPWVAGQRTPPVAAHNFSEP